MTQLPLAKLEAVYAKLPKLDCKGLCQECCGPIGASPVEWRRMTRRGSRPTPPPIQDADGRLTTTETTCRYLTFAGQCAVYNVRPMICRLWGLTEAMRCPYGCVPEGGFLDDVDGLALLQDAMVAGGVRAVDGDEIRRRLLETPGTVDALMAFIRQGMDKEHARAQGRRGDYP